MVNDLGAISAGGTSVTHVRHQERLLKLLGLIGDNRDSVKGDLLDDTGNSHEWVRNTTRYQLIPLTLTTTIEEYSRCIGSQVRAF